MIKVSTIGQAWTVATEIFPTGYTEDIKASTDAGYPIYRSIEEGNYSWISDKGGTLELHIFKGEAIEVTTIQIEEPAAEDTIALSRTLVEDLELLVRAGLAGAQLRVGESAEQLEQIDCDEPGDTERILQIIDTFKQARMDQRELDDLLTRLRKEVNGHA